MSRIESWLNKTVLRALPASQLTSARLDVVLDLEGRSWLCLAASVGERRAVVSKHELKTRKVSSVEKHHLNRHRQSLRERYERPRRY